MSAQTLDNDGGVVVDIAALPLGQQLVAVVINSRKVIRVMNQARRSIPCITVKLQQYEGLMRAARKGRKDNDPRVVGLSIDGVAIRCAGSVQP
jgi:hypothetical protein